jgi:hypothetical protein
VIAAGRQRGLVDRMTREVVGMSVGLAVILAAVLAVLLLLSAVFSAPVQPRLFRTGGLPSDPNLIWCSNEDHPPCPDPSGADHLSSSLPCHSGNDQVVCRPPEQAPVRSAGRREGP